MSFSHNMHVCARTVDRLGTSTYIRHRVLWHIGCVVFHTVVPKPEYAEKLLKSRREMKSLSLGGCLAELMAKSLTTAYL